MGGSHRASEPKPAGSPAAQAFCAAKPWRRRNLLPPSKCNHRRVSAQRREPTKPPSSGRAKWHVNSERSAELS